MDKLIRRDLLQKAGIAGTAVLFSPWFSSRAALAETNSLLPVSSDTHVLPYHCA